MSLRARLTLLFVALMGLALAASGTAGYLIAARRIDDSVNETLRIHVSAITETLEPLIGPVSPTDISTRRTELDDQATADTAFQIRGADGTILYSSDPGNLPPPDAAADQPLYLTRDVRGQHLRILYSPVVRNGQTLATVEIGQSLVGTDSALAEIRNVLILSGLVVAAITSVTAYTLAGRALRPVRQVSQLARDIERTADFSRRLAASTTGAEMSELVATFNAMIGRVEETLLAHKSFLADSSHELRRPLAVLRANIDNLRDSRLPAEEREQCIAEMRAEAEVMGKLLSDLLLLAREESQSIERSPVDLSSLCEHTLARLGTEVAQHEVAASIEAGILVLGDKERLGQMVGNLLENAAQYTPAGGRLDFTLRRSNDVASLRVRDTGTGVSPTDLPRIFDRFYRGEGARAARPDGSGLGLAIVKYVVEAHGGTVSAKSRPGEGTEFAVDLPLQGRA